MGVRHTQSNRRGPEKNEKLPLKSHTHTHSHKCLTKINEWDERIASNWSAACNLPDRLLPSATLYSNQVKRKNVDFTLTRTWRTLTPALSHTYTHTLTLTHTNGAWATSVVATATATWSSTLRAVKMKNCLHTVHTIKGQTMQLLRVKKGAEGGVEAALQLKWY